MPIGIITDCAAVGVAGILGTICGRYIPESTRKYLIVLFGFCAMAIGINSIVKVENMPPVILAVILGSFVGERCGLEQKITKGFSWLLKKLPIRQKKDFNMEQFITAVVLFCASGFGIYGVLLEGFSGNSGILISKSVLDFATAFIFATTLGFTVSIIVAPMIIIMLLLFAFANLVGPLVSDVMLFDFMACGGILTLAAGFRVSGIKSTLIANMIPSLLFVMPLSYLWQMINV